MGTTCCRTSDREAASLFSPTSPQSPSNGDGHGCCHVTLSLCTGCCACSCLANREDPLAKAVTSLNRELSRSQQHLIDGLTLHRKGHLVSALNKLTQGLQMRREAMQRYQKSKSDYDQIALFSLGGAGAGAAGALPFGPQRPLQTNVSVANAAEASYSNVGPPVSIFGRKSSSGNVRNVLAPPQHNDVHPVATSPSRRSSHNIILGTNNDIGNIIHSSDGGAGVGGSPLGLTRSASQANIIALQQHLLLLQRRASAPAQQQQHHRNAQPNKIAEAGHEAMAGSNTDGGMEMEIIKVPQLLPEQELLSPNPLLSSNGSESNANLLGSNPNDGSADGYLGTGGPESASANSPLEGSALLGRAGNNATMTSDTSSTKQMLASNPLQLPPAPMAHPAMGTFTPPRTATATPTPQQLHSSATVMGANNSSSNTNLLTPQYVPILAAPHNGPPSPHTHGSGPSSMRSSSGEAESFRGWHNQDDNTETSAFLNNLLKIDYNDTSSTFLLEMGYMLLQCGKRDASVLYFTEVKEAAASVVDNWVAKAKIGRILPGGHDDQQIKKTSLARYTEASLAIAIAYTCYHLRSKKRELKESRLSVKQRLLALQREEDEETAAQSQAAAAHAEGGESDSAAFASAEDNPSIAQPQHRTVRFKAGTDFTIGNPRRAQILSELKKYAPSSAPKDREGAHRIRLDAIGPAVRALLRSGLALAATEGGQEPGSADVSAKQNPLDLDTMGSPLSTQPLLASPNGSRQISNNSFQSSPLLRNAGKGSHPEILDRPPVLYSVLFDVPAALFDKRQKIDKEIKKQKDKIMARIAKRELRREKRRIRAKNHGVRVEVVDEETGEVIPEWDETAAATRGILRRTVIPRHSRNSSKRSGGNRSQRGGSEASFGHGGSPTGSGGERAGGDASLVDEQLAGTTRSKSSARSRNLKSNRSTPRVQYLGRAGSLSKLSKANSMQREASTAASASVSARVSRRGSMARLSRNPSKNNMMRSVMSTNHNGNSVFASESERPFVLEGARGEISQGEFGKSMEANMAEMREIREESTGAIVPTIDAAAVHQASHISILKDSNAISSSNINAAASGHGAVALVINTSLVASEDNEEIDEDEGEAYTTYGGGDDSGQYIPHRTPAFSSLAPSSTGAGSSLFDDDDSSEYEASSDEDYDEQAADHPEAKLVIGTTVLPPEDYAYTSSSTEDSESESREVPAHHREDDEEGDSMFIRAKNISIAMCINSRTKRKCRIALSKVHASTKGAVEATHAILGEAINAVTIIEHTRSPLLIPLFQMQGQVFLLDKDYLSAIRCLQRCLGIITGHVEYRHGDGSDVDVLTSSTRQLLQNAKAKWFKAERAHRIANQGTPPATPIAVVSGGANASPLLPTMLVGPSNTPAKGTPLGAANPLLSIDHLPHTGSHDNLRAPSANLNSSGLLLVPLRASGSNLSSLISARNPTTASSDTTRSTTSRFTGSQNVSALRLNLPADYSFAEGGGPSRAAGQSRDGEELLDGSAGNTIAAHQALAAAMNANINSGSRLGQQPSHAQLGSSGNHRTLGGSFAPGASVASMLSVGEGVEGAGGSPIEPGKRSPNKNPPAPSRLTPIGQRPPSSVNSSTPNQTAGHSTTSAQHLGGVGGGTFVISPDLPMLTVTAASPQTGGAGILGARAASNSPAASSANSNTLGIGGKMRGSPSPTPSSMSLYSSAGLAMTVSPNSADAKEIYETMDEAKHAHTHSGPSTSHQETRGPPGKDTGNGYDEEGNAFLGAKRNSSRQLSFISQSGGDHNKYHHQQQPIASAISPVISPVLQPQAAPSPIKFSLGHQVNTSQGDDDEDSAPPSVGPPRLDSARHKKLQAHLSISNLLQASSTQQLSTHNQQVATTTHHGGIGMPPLPPSPHVASPPNAGSIVGSPYGGTILASSARRPQALSATNFNKFGGLGNVASPFLTPAATSGPSPGQAITSTSIGNAQLLNNSGGSPQQSSRNTSLTPGSTSTPNLRAISAIPATSVNLAATTNNAKVTYSAELLPTPLNRSYSPSTDGSVDAQHVNVEAITASVLSKHQEQQGQY